MAACQNFPLYCSRVFWEFNAKQQMIKFCVYGMYTMCGQDLHVHYVRMTWEVIVPRPFPPPVFDHLQNANMEGKTCQIWSCVVTSGRQKVQVVPDEESRSPFLYYQSEGRRPEIVMVTFDHLRSIHDNQCLTHHTSMLNLKCKLTHVRHYLFQLFLSGSTGTGSAPPGYMFLWWNSSSYSVVKVIFSIIYLHGSVNTTCRSQLHEQFDMKCDLLLLGTTPRVSTICLPDVTARDQISQASPLRICIL